MRRAAATSCRRRCPWAPAPWPRCSGWTGHRGTVVRGGRAGRGGGVADVNSQGDVAGQRTAVERAVAAAAARGGREERAARSARPSIARYEAGGRPPASVLERLTVSAPRIPVIRKWTAGSPGRGRGEAVPGPAGGEPGAVDRLRGAAGARRRVRLEARGGADRPAQADARWRARPRGGRLRLPREGARGARGRGRVTGKALAGKVAIVTGGAAAWPRHRPVAGGRRRLRGSLSPRRGAGR